jgi:hypothetical protein
MTMYMNFAIKHKVTGLYFAGFGSSNEVLWDVADRASLKTEQAARAQAALFVCNDSRVQRKPVAL